MAEKIGIITDSTSDIPDQFVKDYGIEVVPLRILYKKGEYLDRVDIQPEDVYSRLKEEVPTTSLPRPGDFLDSLQKLKADGCTHVLVLHLSSGLSGTGQLLRNIAEDVKDMVVQVSDSKSISMGLGIQVMEAARAVRNKMSFEAVCAAADQARNNSTVHFVLDTLEYLKRGGRIGRVAGTIGQVLNVKPIIYVNQEGIYETAAKVRGRRQSLEKLVEIAKERLSVPSILSVCHGAAEAEMEYLVNALQNLDTVKELIVSHVSPVIGVHTGPGTVGLVVYNES